MEHTMMVWAQSVKQLCSKSMEPIIEEFDLTMIEIGIILFLAESPACDTCRDIADNLLLAKSNVSTAVDHLVQKGLVGREPEGRVHLVPCGIVIEATEIVLAALCHKTDSELTRKSLRAERVAEHRGHHED